MAMGDRHGLLITIGDVLAGQGEARGVEMIEAQGNPFMGFTTGHFFPSKL